MDNNNNNPTPQASFATTEFDQGTATLIRNAEIGNVASARRNNEAGAIDAISQAVESAAQTFCGVASVPKSVQTECVVLTFRLYGYMAIGEIRNAFALSASKAISADLTAWGGMFPVKIFGDVMAAYSAYRGHVKKQMERQELPSQADEYVPMPFRAGAMDKINAEIEQSFADLAKGAMSLQEMEMSLRGPALMLSQANGIEIGDEGRMIVRKYFQFAGLMKKAMPHLWMRVWKSGKFSAPDDEQARLIELSKVFTAQELERERVNSQITDPAESRRIGSILSDGNGEIFTQKARAMYRKVALIYHLNKSKHNG
jgi:hypothetical protein